MLVKGGHLGYRKLSDGRGSWIAKVRDKTARRLQLNLGSADDALDADGVAVLSFEQAQAKAREWFQAIVSGGLEVTAGKLTVNAAVDRYLEFIKAHRKSHLQLKAGADAYIRARLGKILVADLTTAMVRKWHADIAAEPPRLRKKRGHAQRYREEVGDEVEARRKRQLRANRHLTTLKAALTFAWRDGLAMHRDAWERVKPFSGVERQRSRFLSPPEARQLLDVCGIALRNLVQAALLTGARYGELCALDVRDYIPHSSSLFIRDSKSGKSRHIFLNRSGQAFFQELTAGRNPTEPMLVMENGERWRRDMYFRPFKVAIVAAGIEAAFTFHELRHTWASLTIMNGAPLMVVAQNLGHSDTRMVERHYGHLANHYVRQVILETAPAFELPVCNDEQLAVEEISDS